MTALAEPIVVLARAEYARGKAGRRRWLEARRAGIGGSDAAAVLGLSPWASPLSLWVEKTQGSVDDRQVEAMEWGNVLEDAIARKLARDNGIRLGPCPGILASPQRPYQISTIDRYGLDKHGQPDAVIEVKNASAWKAEDFPVDGPPPDHVVIQVQHQLDVTGLDRGYVAALVGGNQGRWWAMDRDDDLIAMLRAEEERFWDLVQAGIPPAPIGHDADGDALADLYRGDPGREIVLDAATLAAIEQRQRAQTDLALAKETVDFLGQQIKAALGDATEGLRPDGSTAVTWRPQQTTRLDSTALKAARPETWQEFATTTTGRVLRTPKPKKAST
jgi:putative phage-type endonuclease